MMDHFVDIVHHIVSRVKTGDWDALDKLTWSPALKNAAFEALVARHYATADHHHRPSKAPLWLKIWANHFLSELEGVFSVSDPAPFDQVWNQFNVWEAIAQLS